MEWAEAMSSVDVQQHLQSTPIKPLCGDGGGGGAGGWMGCTEQLKSSDTGFRQEGRFLLQPCLHDFVQPSSVYWKTYVQGFASVFVCVCRGIAGVD